MQFIKLNSNCGDFQKPKGHLDTQMYPECKGTPADRDVVKKTREKRKKKKKKKAFNLMKITKIGLIGNLYDSLQDKYVIKSLDDDGNIRTSNPESINIAVQELILRHQDGFRIIALELITET